MRYLSSLSITDKERNARIYDEYTKLGMEDGWYAGNKEQNFAEMIKLAEFTGIPFSGTTCLDIGCGTGDFSATLRRLGILHYRGIDIYLPSLTIAKERYPHEQFAEEDFLEMSETDMFDYIFCSGALSLKVARGNYEFLHTFVSKMWRLSRVGIVFNFLTPDALTYDPDLFCYEKDKILKVLLTIAPEAHSRFLPTPRKAQMHAYMWK